MRSKIATKILNETPPSVRENVRQYGELRERVAAVLEDADAIDKIMAIIQPIRDRVTELEIERAGRKDKQCPF